MRTVPWILSNPIRFNIPTMTPRMPEKENAAASHAFPSSYTAENDPRSAVVLSRAAGELAFHFALGEADDRHKGVYCALADWTKRDLSAYSGISFFVRSDRVYKMEFQLRDEDPEGGPEKTETWAKTFKTYPERRRVRIPFKDLVRFPQKGTNEVLERENTAGCFFILRKDLIRPGTSGTIFFDTIGFY
jgi:hypothetical protein